MMKKILITLIFLCSIYMKAQTFTFIGDGNWTDTAQWENGNYPGITIEPSENVEILGDLVIAEETIITNNGSIETFSSANGDTPSMIILGGLVNNNSVNLSRATVSTEGPEGRIINNAPGVFTVTDNSLVTNFGSIVVFGGTVELSSSVASIINENSFILAASGVLEIITGTFENRSENQTDDATFSNDGSIIISSGEFINRSIFRNRETGIITSSRTFSNEESGVFQNSGVITISEFASAFQNRGNINNSGTLNIGNSTTLNMISGSFLVNQDTGIVNNDGTINNSTITFDNRGGVIYNNGLIDNSARIGNFVDGVIENNDRILNSFGGEIENFAIIRGINTEHSGNFTNRGVLSPGNDDNVFGIYVLDGFFTSYTQEEEGVLEIDLGGTEAGVSYDQVLIERDAFLNGTLNVSLENGFDPNIGDTFTILLQDRNISGAFSSVNLPALADGKTWDVINYSGTDGVVLSVISDQTLGMEQLETPNNDTASIHFYPNPSTEKIFVNGIDKPMQVWIHSSNGQELLTTMVSKNSNSVNINSLARGIYFFKIGSSVTKLVKE